MLRLAVKNLCSTGRSKKRIFKNWHHLTLVFECVRYLPSLQAKHNFKMAHGKHSTRTNLIKHPMYHRVGTNVGCPGYPTGKNSPSVSSKFPEMIRICTSAVLIYNLSSKSLCSFAALLPLGTISEKLMDKQAGAAQRIWNTPSFTERCV